MLTIGEFSRLTRVPAKTLRYYDQIGLFQPLRVDRFTQYRYYSVEQLPLLYRILALKALGLSLDEIMLLLDEHVSPEQIRGMLRLKRLELRQRIEAEQQRLSYVESRIEQLEQEGLMSGYEVILKSVPAYHVVAVREKAPNFAELGVTLNRMFDTCMATIQQGGARINHNPETCGITLFHDSEWMDGPIDVEAAMGFDGQLQSQGDVVVKELPAIELAASTIHHGPFATLNQAYDAVMRWIEQNNYQIVGPSREINLQYERGGDQNKYVTEIQFPVAKRS